MFIENVRSRHHAASNADEPEHRPFIGWLVLLLLTCYSVGLRAEDFNPNRFDAAKIMAEVGQTRSDLTMVVAHRGFHALVDGSNRYVPENSLQAIGLAAKAGLEMVEVDVKLTSDGVPILSHDDNWGREWCWSEHGPGPNDPSERFSPFIPQGSSSFNDSLTFPVNSVSLSGTRWWFWGWTYLRDNVDFQCSSEWPPTLQDVLTYMKNHRIAMVLTLDIKDQTQAAAAWKVVADNEDYHGRPYADTTLFKVAARNFKTGADVLATFSYKSATHRVRLFPYFGTANIAPGVFRADGGEDPIMDVIDDYVRTLGQQLVAIEVDLKQDNGILTDTVQFAKQFGRVGNFSPYVEHWDSNEPSVPKFFSKFGYCCEKLSDYYYHGEADGMPSDTADQRGNHAWVINQGFDLITADDAEQWTAVLYSLGKRNISYMVADDPSQESGGDGRDNGPRDAAALPLRILATGDSITFGYADPSGNSYRAGLASALANDSFPVDFVGRQRSGRMGDNYNEGYSGYKINQVAALLDEPLNKYRPNLVTLMLGTNDCNQNDTIEYSPDRLVSLIRKILDHDQRTAIAVATLIPTQLNEARECIERFNNTVPGIVHYFRSLGYPVVLADMSSLTEADLIDGVHPNAAGFQKMAASFHAAVVTLKDNGWLQPPTACEDIPAGCNDPAIGSSSSGPKPRLPANGWIPAANVASGTDIPGLVQYVDMNGDGKADYVIMDPASGALTVYINNGTDYPNYGGWTGPINYALGAAPASQVQLADVNGDGKADYLIVDPSTGAVDAWLNNGGDGGGGGWSFLGRVAAGGGPGGFVRFADLNGDGRADYIVLDFETGAMQAWLNNGMDVEGGGGWTPLGQVALGAGPASMVRFADINNDYLADYLVLNPVTGAVVAYLNNGMDVPGGGGWTPIGVIAPGTGAPGTVVQFADVNGDGASDYLVLNGRGQTNGWLNDGGDLESNLPPPTIFATPSVPKGPLPRNGWTPVGSIAGGTDLGGLLEYVDMNGDRRADFVMKNLITGALTVYMNWGTDMPAGGGWGPPIAYAAGAAPGNDVVLADVSGDGMADYLIVDPSNGSVKAWLNNGGDEGGGGWIYLGKVAAGAAPSEFVRFADVNGDRYADYLVIDGNTGAISAFINNGMDLPGGGGWIPQGTVALGAAPLGNVVFADLNDDRRADYLIVDHSTGALDAWLNNGMDVPGGNGWTPLGRLAPGVGEPGTWRFFADVNGDGAADYLLATPPRQQTYGWLNNGGDPQ